MLLVLRSQLRANEPQTDLGSEAQHVADLNVSLNPPLHGPAVGLCGSVPASELGHLDVPTDSLPPRSHYLLVRVGRLSLSLQFAMVDSLKIRRLSYAWLSAADALLA